MDFDANKTPAEVITLSAKISCYLCSYIFLGEEGSSEIHFLGEQCWSGPMFWNVFFEEAAISVSWFMAAD